MGSGVSLLEALSLVVAVAAGSIGWWATWRAVTLERRLKRDIDRLVAGIGEEYDATIRKTRAEIADLAEQAEGMFDRARAERLRVQNPKGRPKEERVPAMTKEEYLTHLEKGGRSIPELDRALGLQ